MESKTSVVSADWLKLAWIMSETNGHVVREANSGVWAAISRDIAERHKNGGNWRS